MKTVDLLDLARREYGYKSDYALAKGFGLKQQTINRYRNGLARMDDQTAVLFADKLDLPSAVVLLWIHAERTKCPPAKDAMNKAAELLRHTAAAVIIGVCGVSAGLSPAPAVAAFAPVNNIHYAQRGRARRSLLGWLSALILL